VFAALWHTEKNRIDQPGRKVSTGGKEVKERREEKTAGSAGKAACNPNRIFIKKQHSRRKGHD
jgi:hypothetical protein